MEYSRYIVSPSDMNKFVGGFMYNSNTSINLFFEKRERGLRLKTPPFTLGSKVNFTRDLCLSHKMLHPLSCLAKKYSLDMNIIELSVALDSHLDVIKTLGIVHLPQLTIVKSGKILGSSLILHDAGEFYASNSLQDTHPIEGLFSYLEDRIII